jgi:hypothetical protein
LYNSYLGRQLACASIASVRALPLAAALTLFLPVAASAADPKDALERARLLYNQHQYERAVTAAEEARRAPERADSADLIAARAYLEQYRETAAAEDLANARDRLRRISPQRFVPNERTEFIVGLGEALYFDDAAGAAAALFDSVLAAHDNLLGDARERVLDWWASAVDRDARARSEIDRQGLYRKIRDRMASELAANPASAAAIYWAAAAARGQGDLQAAWDAAQAGWVRAPLTTDQSASLRGDLDNLVLRAIIPERARVQAQSADTLRMEWERFKLRWER